MIAATVDWELLLTAGLLIALAMLLLSRLIHRDPNVKRTQYGWFVERERYDEQEDGWPDLAPPENRTLPTWHDKTAELPPDKPAG